MAVYVDGFVGGGKVKALSEIWSDLKNAFHMDPETPIDKFLGIDVRVEPIDEHKRAILFSQIQYAKTIVDACKADLQLPVDRKLRPISTPGLDHWPHISEPWEIGRFAPDAAKYVGKLMYLHRGSRPDICQVVVLPLR